MTHEEIKEKILANNRVQGWLVNCDICKINGDIASGNCGVICNITKEDMQNKCTHKEHWHYSFENGQLDEISFIG